MPRADARRNLDALLDAAKSVIAESGVDAPVRTIAERAGVGVGTFYRHFPQRSDLIVAVFQREVDATAADAVALEREYGPAEAVERWIDRYVEYVATKHGLLAALYSGDPAYAELPRYFESHLGPALESLYERAVEAGEMRPDVAPMDLLGAVANLAHADDGSGRAARMIALLLDGLRVR